MSLSSSLQSPSHNSDQKTFTDYFWSSDRNITEGVNVLYEASKVSVQNTKLLMEILQEHIDLEKDYNRRMKKLTEKVRGVSDEKNTISPIWKNLSAFYTSVNMMHSHHFQDLINAHKSLLSYSVEEKKAASSLTKMWDQANSLKQQYNKSFQHYSTSKSQFYIVSQSVQKSNLLDVASVGTTESPETGEELVRSQEEYKTSVTKHQSSVQQTVNKLFTIFFEFESFEKGRIAKLSERVQEVLAHISKFFRRASSISEGTCEQVKAISDEKDSILADFARRYGPKGHRPLSPSYDDPPNVAELENELAPTGLNRTISAQSVGSDRPKSGTPKPSKKSLSAEKPGKKKSRAFGHRKSKAAKSSNEPSTQNPNFQPEQSVSHTPSPSDDIPTGFVMDEDGCLVRIEDEYPHPRLNTPSTDDSDSDSPSADAQIRKIKINPKNTLLDREDNTEDLYRVVPQLQLAGPITNLTSRKSTSANELSARRQNSSIEDLIAPLKGPRRQRTELEDLMSGPRSFTDSHQRMSVSIPPNTDRDGDRDSDPDLTRTPTPVDPPLQQEAFPSLSGGPALNSNFSNDFASLRPSKVPLSKEDDFTFTSNYTNSPSTDAKSFTPTNQKLSLSFTNSSPAFVPLPPPTILPPPIALSPPSKLLRPKTSQGDGNNRKFQIIPEVEFSPTRSIPDSPQAESPEMSRPDSSMSFTNDVIKCSSPGSEVVPLAVNLQEKIHVFYRHSQLTERFVRLEGLLTLAFMNSKIENMQQELRFSLDANGGYKCLDPSLLSQNQTEEEFCFKMDALKEYLLQQRASSPGQSYSTLQALTYNVKIPVSAAPLLLDVHWDPDSMVDQTQLDVHYRYNPDGFPILSPHPLENVVITVKYDVAVSDCELEPVGHWAKPNNSVIWKVDTVSSQKNSSGKLKAIFSHFPDTKLSQVIEVSFKAGGTLSGTEFKLKGVGFNLARTKRSLISGVYKSEN